MLKSQGEMDKAKMAIFFHNARNIVKKHESFSILTGENFNIFRILGLHSAEVKTHSAFLAELLNTKGSHGQGPLFLRLFVDYFKISSFTLEPSEAFVEKYIGQINKEGTSGGRIDILVKDASQRKIIIENKIYAKDQENQLLRYYNYDRDASLFYLTLNGDNPSDISTGGDTELNVFRCISYRVDIVNWLTMCKKECVSLPLIRETICQYINLIKSLTGQAIGDKMRGELISLIKENPELGEAINLCAVELNRIVVELRDIFLEKVRNKLTGYEEISLGEGQYLRIEFGEDTEGVYLAYVEVDIEGNDIQRDNRDKEIFTSLKGFNKFNINEGYGHNLWWYAGPFRQCKKFANLGYQQIIEMSNETGVVDKLVQSIVEEELEVRTFLLENFSKK